MVKNLPATQEIRVQSLGPEDPLEKSMAALCSILAGKSPWTEEPGGLKPIGLQRVGHSMHIHIHTETQKTSLEGEALRIRLKGISVHFHQPFYFIEYEAEAR